MTEGFWQETDRVNFPGLRPGWGHGAGVLVPQWAESSERPEGKPATVLCGTPSGASH